MKKISECRVCGSKALTPVFTLEAASLGPRRPAIFGGRRAGDIDFVLCDPARDARACGLVQSAHSRAPIEADPAPSSRYAATRAALRCAATEALEMISGRDCAALDIGCSDGALLSYYPRWVDRYGVDPCADVEAIGEWAWTARAAFPSAELESAFGEKKFDIVTAISVLEECDNPRELFAAVKARLTGDGVLILETLYAPMTLTRVQTEPLIAGAAAIYSLGVLERLARDTGLKIFRGALTDKEGGSIRLFLTHDGVDDHDFDPWYERLARLWDEENALALRAHAPYQAFEQRAGVQRAALVAMLSDIMGRGESVHLLGAGPASAALLVWAREAAAAIGAAIDEPAVAGARLLDGPAIISEIEGRAAEPDYFLAPVSLKREMLERWREQILLGARILFAGPEPHVVHAQNYAAELARVLAGGDGQGGVETLRAILGAAGGPRLVAANAAKAASA